MVHSCPSLGILCRCFSCYKITNYYWVRFIRPSRLHREWELIIKSIFGSEDKSDFSRRCMVMVHDEHGIVQMAPKSWWPVVKWRAIFIVFQLFVYHNRTTMVGLDFTVMRHEKKSDQRIESMPLVMLWSQKQKSDNIKILNEILEWNQLSIQRWELTL